MNDRKRWLLLGGAVAGAFLVLGFFGREVYRQAPPIPARVVTTAGETLLSGDDILTGQQVWQSIGGQQLGSVWGHGAYQAPDWSADWLHREALALLALWSAREDGAPYESLHPERQAQLRERLRTELRKNSFDAGSDTLTLSEDRAAAVAAVRAHFDALFAGGAELAGLREAYALHDSAVPDAERRARLCDFFFWSSWACATERPGSSVTYTNNWPHEPLIGNAPSTANVAWSVLSVVLLLAGVAGLAWWKAAKDRAEPSLQPPAKDPLAAFPVTPSMRALKKYVAVIALLFLVQVLLGALTAHYTVEGRSFFGLPLADWLPYSLTRTWHIQTGMFWIATAFLAAGLFLAPVVGGREPRFQRLGVNVLFGALLVVVAGSLAGEWLAVQQVLDLDLSFWFGHQGYEYVDLGRAWQIALMVGLALWLVLVLRGLWPALARAKENKNLLHLFAGSAVAIGLFYGAGMFYGARTHLSVAEYWRWWVVHLWVEGFFEVFATAAIAFLFSHLGLVKAASAGRAALFATGIFLVSGIPGTFHHLYFSGAPVSILAVGASFSALEVVPLVLIGFEAVETLRAGRGAAWMERYRWPIRCFVAVAFWNLVGAGLFGFLINPPLALYYMQGLNTTPVHAHAALFGVYGLLSLGLVLLILRRLTGTRTWNERPLAIAFWCMNGGLVLMIALSLLPIGLMQTFASIEHGFWYARSADFLQSGTLETLRWLRIVGDTVFLAGVGIFTLWTLNLLRRRADPRTALAQTEPAVAAA